MSGRQGSMQPWGQCECGAVCPSTRLQGLSRLEPQDQEQAAARHPRSSAVPAAVLPRVYLIWGPLSSVLEPLLLPAQSGSPPPGSPKRPHFPPLSAT